MKLIDAKSYNTMEKIGLLDMKILHLGIKSGGHFNEKNLESSDLKNLGVGRILDTLASLRERKFIDLTDSGEFTITNSAKDILWSNEVPLWLRILRLLEIKSFDLYEISKYLLEPKELIQDSLESLRKNQLVLMEPIRKDGKLEKIFEILQDGREELEKIEKEGYHKAELAMKDKDDIEILEMIDSLIKDIQSESLLSEEKKQSFADRLANLKDRLGV